MAAGQSRPATPDQGAVTPSWSGAVSRSPQAPSSAARATPSFPERLAGWGGGHDLGPVSSTYTPDHLAGSVPFDRRPGEGLRPAAEALPAVLVVQSAPRSTPGVLDLPTTVGQSATPPSQA